MLVRKGDGAQSDPGSGIDAQNTGVRERVPGQTLQENPGDRETRSR